MKYIEKKCEHCGKPYNVETRSKYWVAKRKYCGHGCAWEASRKPTLHHCRVCGIDFGSKTKRVRYCSSKCGQAFIRQKKLKKEQLKLSKVQPKILGGGKFDFAGQVLTLKNYKEPLAEIPRSEGVGWYGTLASTLDGTGVQCHICGYICKMLPGHIYNVHGMRTKQYREKYGLAASTALFSEDLRLGNKKRTLAYLKTLTQEQREEYRQAAIARLREGHKHRTKFQPQKSLEQKNIEGTCPDQLLERIKVVKEKLGRVPSKDDYIREEKTQRFVHLIYKTFGSWSKAVEMCNFPKEDDHRQEALEASRKTKKKIYSREELIELLRIYTQENQQIPTATDFRRDFLPEIGAFVRKFGGIEAARQAAGVYDLLDKPKPGRWIKPDEPTPTSI